MISFRRLEWPQDRAAVLQLDTSSTCDRIYRLVRKGATVVLENVPQTPRATKIYDLALSEDSFARADWAMVALVNDAIIGVAAMAYEQWNRRARLEHLYVDRGCRGQGIGRLLVESALAATQAAGLRCLWVETQTNNAPAIDFYRHLGFEWCGFDTSLYDPTVVSPSDTALFLGRAVDGNVRAD